MRVLQIIHQDQAGGVKTLAGMIGDGLTAHGLAVDTAILFPAPGMRAKLLGTLRVAGRILTGRYDAVIAYQPSASILTGIVGWLARCPRRIVHQTALPGEIKGSMRALDRIAGTLGLYTVNVVNSQATAAAYANYPVRYRRALAMIEHGVAAQTATRGRAATLPAFGIPAAHILLNVGRLTEQKNQGVLIRALARIPSARLVIAGDGPERPDYAALAAKFGVTDRLHMLGDMTRGDVADLLAAADLFVFPSVRGKPSGLRRSKPRWPACRSSPPICRCCAKFSAQGGAAATFVAPADTDGWIAAIEASAVNSTARTEIVTAIAQRYSVARMVEAYAALLERTARSGRALKKLEPHGTGVA